MTEPGMTRTGRAGRIRAAAKELSTRHGIPFTADFESGSSTWQLSWVDGPARSNVAAYLRTLDLGADVRTIRYFTPRAIALAAIRQAANGQTILPLLDDVWPRMVANVDDSLVETDNPGSVSNPREEQMVARLLEAATTPHASGPDKRIIIDLVRKRGIGWLLPDPLPDPIDVLTVRYAEGEAKWRWDRHASPMRTEGAIAAALADTEIDATAALALLRLLAHHRDEQARAEASAVDAALRAGANWTQIALAVGVGDEDQARTWALTSAGPNRPEAIRG